MFSCFEFTINFSLFIYIKLNAILDCKRKTNRHCLFNQFYLGRGGQGGGQGKVNLCILSYCLGGGRGGQGGGRGGQGGGRGGQGGGRKTNPPSFNFILGGGQGGGEGEEGGQGGRTFLFLNNAYFL